ncbi:hypothetical protein ACEZ3G_05630 [Maribacter algicola]|uniref:Uncharacterized protein n=1 Tax=Meishania litoralis TaxID=3434685 RepID=A0ACC7LHM2_9FLAO
MGINKAFFFALLIFGCTSKKSKSDIDITFTPDTLNVGYTYWWPESGPFIGECGNELSLVFTGSIKALKEPNDDPGPLYTSQEGIIEIDRVFKIKALGENTYANQKFMVTDCFHGLGLNIGDQVIVFCYDYEGGYSIPGGKSILKVTSLDDPLVESIKKYIDSNQDPRVLQEDITLWTDKEMGSAVEKISACHEEMSSMNNTHIDINN